MEENIYLSELLLLTLWICSPVLIISFIIEAFVILKGKKHFISAQFVFLKIAIITMVGILPLSMLFWATLPNYLLPPSALPGPPGNRYIPPFFLPSILAAMIVVPLVLWWYKRHNKLLENRRA